MTDDLKGTRIAILATDGVERVELEQPRGALYGAGASSDLLSDHSGEIQARQFDLVSAGTFPVDRLVSDASAEDYDGLLLPGGVVNPDKLRTSGDAVAFVQAMVAMGKPVAAICHGPWTLLEAGVLRGHRLTSWPSLWTDLRNAGAEPVDQEVVTDGQFTTSRSPADLPHSARRASRTTPEPPCRAERPSAALRLPAARMPVRATPSVRGRPDLRQELGMTTTGPDAAPGRFADGTAGPAGAGTRFQRDRQPDPLVGEAGAGRSPATASRH